MRLASGSTFNATNVLCIATGAWTDLNAGGSSWVFAGLNDLGGTGGAVDNAGGTRTLKFQGAGSYSFSGRVKGNINLEFGQNGQGTHQLSGDNSYNGTTKVLGGMLLVNGDQSAAKGAVTVSSGATLGGGGVIGGATTINSGGKLTPGNSLGTLTFTNNLNARRHTHHGNRPQRRDLDQ